VTGFARLVGRQLRQPSGFLGRAFGFILNRANRCLNRRVVERLGIRPDEGVLDVGFGGGVGLRHALAAGAGLAAGIEISAAMLSQGQRRFRGEVASGRVELRRGDVSGIPFDDARFDAAFSTNAIYFWPDPAAGIAEIRRVLKPGGRLVLGTAAIETMKRRPFTREGFRLFTDEELATLLRDTGFAEVSVERIDDSVFTSGRA
jgi:arsenite methyltransferase